MRFPQASWLLVASLFGLVGPAPCIAASKSAANYSDIWWNPQESGWGLTIADHETNIFAVWYTYREDGQPIWYVIPGGTFSTDRRFFQGDIYVTAGPPDTSSIFDPSLVRVAKVGTASIDFSPPGAAQGAALFTYSLDPGIGTKSAITQTKQIQRQPFGDAAPDWGSDLTDIYYNPNESGWGLTLAQHGSTVFGVFYVYDTDGQPLWVVMPGAAFDSSGSLAGDLYTTTGPFWGGASFDPSRVKATLVGTARSIHTNASGLVSGAYSWVKTALQVSRTFAVTREPFGNSPPAPTAPSGDWNGTLVDTYSSTCTSGNISSTTTCTFSYTVSGSLSSGGNFVGTITGPSLSGNCPATPSQTEPFTFSVLSSGVAPGLLAGSNPACSGGDVRFTTNPRMATGTASCPGSTSTSSLTCNWVDSFTLSLH